MAINLDAIKEKSAYHNALCVIVEKLIGNAEIGITEEDAEKKIENIIKKMRDEARKNAVNGCAVITPDRAEDLVAEEFKIDTSAVKAEDDAAEIVDIMDLL